jgi:hypothetical protein
MQNTLYLNRPTYLNNWTQTHHFEKRATAMTVITLDALLYIVRIVIFGVPRHTRIDARMTEFLLQT